MNNITKTKLRLTESVDYNKAVKGWLNDLKKPFPKMKIEYPSKTEYVVFWNKTPFLAIEVKGDFIKFDGIGFDVKSIQKKYQKIGSVERMRKMVFDVLKKSDLAPNG